MLSKDSSVRKEKKTKYVCAICGYVYDEEKIESSFKDLPDSWTCPLCGAPKSAFVPLEDKKKEETKKPTRALLIDEDMEKYPH